MKPSWMTMLREHRAAGFDAISGATASLVVPISDELITDVGARQLSASVRDLEIRAVAGNRFNVAVGLRKPAWLPRIKLQLGIERQPRFPDDPVLVLRLMTHGGLAMLAGPAARLFGALPSWLEIDGDRVQVDLGALLREYDAADALSFIRRAAVTTRKGAVVLALDAAIP